MSDYGMVIVGGGEAGARAAVELRNQGWNGNITLIGNEKFPPYERPPLSKQFLTNEEKPMSTIIINENQLHENKIHFQSGVTATSLDRENHILSLSDGNKLKYERLLLCTGAKPRRLTIPGSGIEGILYLRTIGDSLKIRNHLKRGSHVVIIGGGFIGLEVAASAITRGCQVTLIEAAPRILMRGVDEEIADMVKALHTKKGVEFIIGKSLKEINQIDGQFTVELGDGQSISSDIVIAGIGAIPETTLAEENGLDIENGIKVDKYLMTNDSDINAAGDCCSFPHPLYGGRRVRLEAYRNAQEQGIHAAKNMVNLPTPYLVIPWFWSDQYDRTLQVAGFADNTKKIVRDLGDEEKIFFHFSENNFLKAVSGIGTQRITKEIRIAEMLIEKQVVLDPEVVSNPSNNLKKLLRAY
ncbi:FAD-dependent oxidoreductase [Bacillus sp. JJ1521]|uniref:NAD(P)/FAD-dependent oxidoreductase n=1 Tax=Bacillus sp. JJ1521 TaxID=3122957 RepID=UPI00300099F7